MNTSDITTRPFGYWVTAVDRLLRAEFATVFADEGITRRDWRLLNRIAGTVPGEHGTRPGHAAGSGHGSKLRRLVELEWIERTRDGWALTDAGDRAQKRLGTAVDEIRARVANAVTPDEYAAMTAALEKIAREFGWEEGKRLPRSRRHERGHRHGEHGYQHDHNGREHGHRGHGFGPHGFGHTHRGFGPHGGGKHGFGPHGHYHRFGKHGFHPAMAPATHIHIHTNS